MKAIALFPQSTTLKIVEMDEPTILHPNEVKLKVLEVGICGTDREEAAGFRGDPPQGQDYLIIGHEMIGKVVEVGSAVNQVVPGDFAVVSVRRSCGHCPACALNRFDMCYTGDYKERGIKELDGFQAEYVVEQEEFLVRVPPNIVSFAVLTEPTTVVEKAIDEATIIQKARLPDAAQQENWLSGKKVLVAGLGPIGLLAAMILRLRGATVLGLDIVDADSARPKLLKSLGGKYIDGREVQTENIAEHCGEIDMIVEATGIAKIEFNLLEALGVNGIIVLTGIPSGDRCINIEGAELMKRLVLKNQTMLGSVNASPTHFRMAVEDLTEAGERWEGVMNQLITTRVSSQDMDNVLQQHPDEEIKSTIQWDGS